MQTSARSPSPLPSPASHPHHVAMLAVVALDSGVNPAAGRSAENPLMDGLSPARVAAPHEYQIFVSAGLLQLLLAGPNSGSPGPGP